MNRILLISLLFISWHFSLFGQEKLQFTNSEQSHFDIPFEISQNLIILPARINGSGIMKFILDSGITNTIITEMTGVDTVTLKLAREVQLEGLGEGKALTAWYSDKNELLIESPLIGGRGIIGKEMEVFVIPEDRFEFSKQFGLQINGLIGADFFTHYVVEINYLEKLISFNKRDDYNFAWKTRRHRRIPLLIENKRPYLAVKMIQEDGPDIMLKLLVDTGASMSMWLSLFSDQNIKLPEITFPALLGQGLNGNIVGVNGRIKGVKIGPFSINHPIVAFPDSIAIAGMMSETDRNGTLGNEVLKRFHVIFDYQGQQCFLKPNKKFHYPFNYNRSGLEIEKPFYNLPIYQIYNVVKGSPADLSGLMIGDQIEMMNFLQAVNLELDQINSILYGTEGKVIRMRVKRDGIIHKAKFTLDSKL